jgi:hypothetical protein
MDKIRIWSRDRYRFQRWGEKEGAKVVLETATTEPLSFCEVPEWVKEDPLWAMTVASGTVKEFVNHEQELEVELAVAKKGNLVRTETLVSRTKKGGS